MGSNAMKIFCVGRGKTGTTSMAAALRLLGFKVGSPLEAGRLQGDWAKRDFRRLIEYCKGADAFQDTPFSLNYTFQAMDAAFPKSKFILTVRDTPEQWYESITRFHSKISGASGPRPSVEDLKKYKGGWLLDSQKLIYGVDENNLYDQDIYKKHYIDHNAAVMDYFKHRPEDLLVLNLAVPDAMEQICRFLGIRFTGQKLPHANKTATATPRN